MGLKFYLSLLILLGPLYSETGASSEDKESSDFHNRKKRLIDYSSHGNPPVSITKVPYVVDVHEEEERICGGAILSSIIIITAAHCVEESAKYSIISGSGRIDCGKRHNVTKKIINQQYWRDPFEYDLALLKISPPIDLVCSPNRPIELHDGYILPNSVGTISGWGCTHKTALIYPDELRSITVPIISEWACETLYRGFTPITDKVICTFDIYAHKSTCVGDSGNPLVVDGRLLGVHAYNKKPLKYPSVHIKVSEYNHAVWIHTNMRELSIEV